MPHDTTADTYVPYAERGPLWRALSWAWQGRGRRSVEAVPVAVVQAYFDESIHGRVGGIGGYIGLEATWDTKFAPAWINTLASAPHPITWFHAADCHGGYGEFRKSIWSQAERTKMAEDFVAVINKSPSIMPVSGLACAILYPEGPGARFSEKHIQHECYKAAFVKLILDLTALCRVHFGTTDELQIIMGDRPSLKGWVTNCFDDTVNRMRAALPDGSHISGPHFECTRKVPALQAADLLVYETMQEVQARLSDPAEAVSPHLLRLLENNFHAAVLVDVDQVWNLHRSGNDPSRHNYPLVFRTGSPLRAVGPGLW